MSKSLSEFLQVKAREHHQDEQLRHRQEWLASLDRLMARFRAWLQEADTEKILLIEDQAVDRAERGLGRYRAPSLWVTLGEVAVHVLPIAYRIVGPRAIADLRSAGRVDITNGTDKHVLVRMTADDREEWHALDERDEPVPLDQARFEAIFQELLA